MLGEVDDRELEDHGAVRRRRSLNDATNASRPPSTIGAGFRRRHRRRCLVEHADTTTITEDR